MSGGDVQEDDLVRALDGVALRQLGGIALVGEIDELRSLDDAAVGDVEAGDYSTGKHHATSEAGAPPATTRGAAARAPGPAATSARKLPSSRWPAAADFSGWNCRP